MTQCTLTNASAALVEGFTGTDLLPRRGGGLVMLGCATVVGVVGWVLATRRDVT